MPEFFRKYRHDEPDGALPSRRSGREDRHARTACRKRLDVGDHLHSFASPSPDHRLSGIQTDFWAADDIDASIPSAATTNYPSLPSLAPGSTNGAGRPVAHYRPFGHPRTPVDADERRRRRRTRRSWRTAQYSRHRRIGRAIRRSVWNRLGDHAQLHLDRRLEQYQPRRRRAGHCGSLVRNAIGLFAAIRPSSPTTGLARSRQARSPPRPLFRSVSRQR